MSRDNVRCVKRSALPRDELKKSWLVSTLREPSELLSRAVGAIIFPRGLLECIHGRFERSLEFYLHCCDLARAIYAEQTLPMSALSKSGVIHVADIDTISKNYSMKIEYLWRGLFCYSYNWCHVLPTGNKAFGKHSPLIPACTSIISARGRLTTKQVM